MGLRLCVLIQIIALCVDTMAAASEGSHVTSPRIIGLNFMGLSSLYKLYKQCLSRDASKSAEECLSTQIVILTDQMVHQNRIPLMDGVTLVGQQQSSGRSLSEGRTLTEEEVEASLPRSLEARQGVLDRLMLQKLSDFLTTHSLQVEVHIGRKLKGKLTNKQTPWPESASELFRPSEGSLSVKLAPTFADRGVSRSQHGGSPTAVISDFYSGAASFSSKQLLSCTHGPSGPRSRPTTSQKI
jgi:hypothetical protein